MKTIKYITKTIGVEAKLCAEFVKIYAWKMAQLQMFIDDFKKVLEIDVQLSCLVYEQTERKTAIHLKGSFHSIISFATDSNCAELERVCNFIKTDSSVLRMVTASFNSTIVQFLAYD